MRSTKMTLGLVALLGLAACGEEGPVDLGGLLPGGGVRTGEAVFEAPAFLEWDSVRTGFILPSQADFVVAASEFGGNLDAHGLIRLERLPRTLSYNDHEGALRVDTLPTLIGGRLTLRVDSLRTVASGPFAVRIYQVTEDWDLKTANWVNRLDTGSVALPWTDPGGTHGELIDVAQYVLGDSVLGFNVDTTTLASLRDSATAVRGLLVQVESPGARLEFGSASLRFEIQPALRSDTIFTDSVQLQAKTFVANLMPDPEAEGAILIGGLPSWRSYLRLKEGIDTLSVPCPGGPAGCTFRLSDVVINYAGIEFQPIGSYPGFALVDTAAAESRAVLPVEGVPISRTPLGVQLGGMVRIPPPSTAGAVAIPVTTLISAMASDSVSQSRAPRTMALIGAPEGTNFGLAAFGSVTAGPLAPRLRLIYSVTNEVQDR